MANMYLYTLHISLNPENYLNGTLPFYSVPIVAVICDGPDKWELVKGIIKAKKADIAIEGPWAPFDISKVSDADIEAALAEKYGLRITPLRHGLVTFSALDG